MTHQAPGTIQGPSARTDIERKPYYLIIGAAKSATSWLQKCLADHPQAHMNLGEPHHFSYHFDPRDPLPQTYLDTISQGAEPGQIIGENSNTYMPHPFCAQRIASVLPDVKLIVSLRNPVERAYSDWAMRIRQQVRMTDMYRFIDPDYAPNLWFIHKGLYYQQITDWLKYFDRTQMLILIAEDYKTDAHAQFATLCRFLEIDEHVVPESLTARVNTRDQRLIFPGIRKKLRGHSAYRRLDDMLRASLNKERWRGFLGRDVSVPPLDDATRRKLCDFYREDVRSLSGLLDRDLTFWTKN